MARQFDRTTLDAARGRGVSTASGFSTVLLHYAICAAQPSQANRVLDVGCGKSPYRELLQPQHYIGMDRGELGPHASLIGDATALPFADASFDAIICTEVIEHVPDEHALSRELARVASASATLLLSSPFVHGLHEQPYDFRRLTSIGLAQTLTDAGWQIAHITPIGGPGVVALDSFVRWADATVRRIARRVPIPGLLGVVTAGSRWFQKALAAAVLACPLSRFEPIDVDSSTPRLTLGYVVSARR